MAANSAIPALLRPMILVVEDEPLVSRAILLLANQFGLAHLAPTATAARTALSGTERWDAFVIDVGLPDGSGMDVLVRAREVHPRASALILTGRLSPQVANAAFDLGATCVAKPVNAVRLTRFLEQAASCADPVSYTARDWIAKYALSSGEADVLLKAANGSSRDEIAGSRGSSPLTVKRQESHVHARTGDASFHDAVSRLLRQAARGRH